MKKYIITLLILLLPAISYAEDFLDAPVIPDSQTVNKEGNKLTYKTDLSHEDALSFYRDKLSSFDDIKYRDWEDSTYIEDDGSRPWHSITIFKANGEQGTTIVIAKDSWTWIIGTLILRYIAVFVVLLVVYIAMKVSGGIISSSVKKAEPKKA